MTNDLICPHCERSRLQISTFDEVMKFRGEELLVSGLQGYKCLDCGEWVISPAQIRSNHAIYAEKKAEAANLARARVGMLDGNEIRAVREQLCLTQLQMARALGCAPMTFSKYERGEVMQSAAVDVLLRMIRAVPGAAHFIRARAGIEEQWTTIVTSVADEVLATNVVRLDSRSLKHEAMPAWESSLQQRRS